MRKTLSLLDEFQLDAAGHIVENKNSALWILMGRGKTVTALTALNYIDYERALILAPPMVCKTVWPNEIKEWEHIDETFEFAYGPATRRKKILDGDQRITALSVHNTEWLCKTYNTKLRWRWDVLIIDESGFFRSFNKRFRALRKCTKFCDRIVTMTGTPAPNRYDGLYTQFYLLDRGERLGRTLGDFHANWFKENFFGYGYDIRNQKCRNEIQEKVSDLTFVLDVDDKELPPVVFRSEMVELDPKSQRLYDALEKDSYVELPNDVEVDPPNGGVKVQKLMQWTSGGLYYRTEDDPDTRLVYVTGNEKQKRFKEIFEGMDGTPMLVAYRYQHEREWLKKIKGVELFNKSTDQIERFNRGEIAALAANPASIGHGLNLQSGSSFCLWISLPDDGELYQQFCYRLIRRGQKNKVVIMHLLAKNTADYPALESLQKKDLEEKALIKGVTRYIREKYEIPEDDEYHQDIDTSNYKHQDELFE